MIQLWNTQINGKCETTIKILEGKMNMADEIGYVIESNIIQDKLINKYEELDAILRQKSRSSWLLEGDSNTRFYHAVVKRRRSKNNIQGIMHK